jgi:MoxR-like ATPase
MKTARNSLMNLYEGRGETLAERGLHLPPFERPESYEAPELYLASKGLRAAVNVAIMLGQPLLITGEPGTGKTRLADSIAFEFGGLPLLKFHTKSTSIARDLFYHYDALRHFRDVQFETRSSAASPTPAEAPPPSPAPAMKRSADPYITYNALGLAILLTLEAGDPRRERVNSYIGDDWRKAGGTRSVVLVDEIDKAPRDFPNDILNEIEDMEFEVRELDAPPFKAVKELRPVVVLTSNSEKNLPEAFLRRCVFYHIEFPRLGALRRIVERRLGPAPDDVSPELRKHALHHFKRIRDLKLKKAPATAELLAWIRVLEKIGLDPSDPGLTPQQERALIYTYSILAKGKGDMDTITHELHPKEKMRRLTSAKADDRDEDSEEEEEEEEDGKEA